VREKKRSEEKSKSRFLATLEMTGVFLIARLRVAIRSLRRGARKNKNQKQKQISRYARNDRLFQWCVSNRYAATREKSKIQKQQQIPHFVRDDSLTAGCHFRA
jgi:hypothetical protein